MLQNGVAATVRVRITQSGQRHQVHRHRGADLLQQPDGRHGHVNPGGNPYNARIVTDGFIRLGGGDIANNGTLTVTFTTTPNCTSGIYLVSSIPSTNATNPPSGTNQSVSTTGGSLTVAAGLANLSITKTDSPDPVAVRNADLHDRRHERRTDPASAVKVVDTLPAGTTFVSATGTRLELHRRAHGTVTCNRTAGNLPVGAAPPKSRSWSPRRTAGTSRTAPR